MQRPITGFRLDDQGDWVAVLSCGHPQHVRHNPPLMNRPWVLTPEGRDSRLGEPLNCVRCDDLELPDTFVPSGRTPVFTEATIPDALKANHATATGVWGRVHVVEGTLRYRAESLGVDMQLSPDTGGVIVPEVRHSVAPTGPVRFYVQFYRAPEVGS